MNALEKYRVKPSGLIYTRPSGDADLVISEEEAGIRPNGTSSTDADTDIEVPQSMRSYITRREWASRPQAERQQLAEQAQGIERAEREGREAREAKVTLIRNIGQFLGQTGEALNAFIRARQEASLRAIERHAQEMNAYANERRRADEAGTDAYISQILRENPPSPPRQAPLPDSISVVPSSLTRPIPQDDNSKLVVIGVLGVAAVLAGIVVYSRRKR